MPSPARASKMLRTPPIEGLDDLERRIGDLRAATEKAGREVPPEVIFTPMGAAAFGGQVTGVDQFVDEIQAHAAIGVDALTINLPGDDACGVDRRGPLVRRRGHRQALTDGAGRRPRSAAEAPLHRQHHHTGEEGGAADAEPDDAARRSTPRPRPGPASCAATEGSPANRSA